MNPVNDEFEKQTEKILARMAAVKNKIIVMSGKGGVGKSTVSVNLAAATAAEGFKTGLLDIDLHGPNVPRMLGIDGQRLVAEDDEIIPFRVYENLTVCSMAMLGADPKTPIIWRGPRKSGVIRQLLGDVRWGGLDYLFLDTPPGTGDEILSAVQAVNGWTGAVVVVTPQEVALDDGRRSLAFAAEMGLKVLGIVENMSGFICPHCGAETEIFKRGGGEKLAAETGTAFLGRVPLEPRIAIMSDGGEPFCLKAGGTSAGKAFASVAGKIIAMAADGAVK